MQVRITPGTAYGSVMAPPSKSMSHRLLICAGLSKGQSIIHGISACDDVLATMDCLRAMGAECSLDGDCAIIRGIDARTACPQEAMRCRESGSTLRFLIPTALLCGHSVLFIGAHSLMQRPMHVYSELCQKNKMYFHSDGDQIIVRGPLQAGNYHLVGNVSSQFISGLLFALPLAEGGKSYRHYLSY